jgi:hypothetical protein
VRIGIETPGGYPSTADQGPEALGLDQHLEASGLRRRASGSTGTFEPFCPDPGQATEFRLDLGGEEDIIGARRDTAPYPELRYGTERCPDLLHLADRRADRWRYDQPGGIGIAREDGEIVLRNREA